MDVKRWLFIGLSILICMFIWAFHVGDAHGSGSNVKIKNYRQAKRSYLPVVWSDNAKTFYCGCSMSGKMINAKSCGYKPKRVTRRSKIREWEHIVPASRLGALISKCGYVGKRRACLRRRSEIFNRMEADLHNIVPAIGELNAARSNFSFGSVLEEVRKYGSCDFEVENGIVEPRLSIRGDIARAYLYMANAYPDYLILTEREELNFENWNLHDPPSMEEKNRNRIIKKIQGNGNRFIELTR